jgi:hypothetical protein
MSLTASLNAHLDVVAVICFVLLIGLVLYRVVHLLVALLLNLLPIFAQPAAGRSTRALLRRFATMGILGQALQFFIALLLAAARVLLALFQAGLWVAWIMLPFLILAFTLVLVHERWADTMLMLTRAFNGPIGALLRWFILAPLTVLDTVGTYVLPVWNFSVLVLVQLPFQLLTWLLSGSGAYHLLLGLREFGAMVPAAIPSVRAFVDINTQLTCPTCLRLLANDTYGPHNTTHSSLGDACPFVLSPAIAAQACLDPSLRILDFGPAFAHARAACTHLVVSLGMSCEALAIMLNITLYPLTDASMWYAADRGLNAVLNTLVSAPVAAIARCELAGGFVTRPAMCTPDFGPAWSLAAQAALALGDAFTHWFNIAYMWIFQGKAAMELACDSDALYTRLLWPAVRSLMTPGRDAVLVRLTNPQKGFAVTDGRHVMWGGDLPRLRWSPAADAWPIPIEPRFGVAAVTVAAGLHGLMGCACDDLAWRADRTKVQLQCAILLEQGLQYDNASAWVLPLEFSLGTEAQLLTCARLRINVQSVRWAQPRIAAARQTFAGVPRAQLTADAAVYVTPICGQQDGYKALACLPSSSYTRGICFPYCMGLRFQREAFRPIVIRGAAEWTEGVVLSNTDCSPSPTTSLDPDNPLLVSPQIRVTCRVATDVAAQSLPSGNTVEGAATTCAYSTTCSSAIADKTRLLGYGAQTVLPSAAQNAGARLWQNGQPLVIAGGVQMRAFSRDSDDASMATTTVDFPSLVGNQVNEFTIEPANPDGIPLSPDPPATPSQQAPFALRSTIDLPPTNVQSGPIPFNPGTRSPNALWYATNPSYEWIYSFAQYCASKGTNVSMQVMLLSNYAPIRIQRVLLSPGACYINALTGDQACREDLFLAQVMERTLPALNSDTAAAELYALCNGSLAFNLYVESLEYWDEANIVIAVRRGTVADLGTLIAEQAGGGASAWLGGHTVYYYYRVSDANRTLAAREGVPWPNGDCRASLSVMPDLGGMVGHSLAALCHGLGALTNLFFNPFAILELLEARAADACPENALQHSALDDCGMALLSLDKAFAEAYEAGHATWGVILWLVDLLFPTSGAASTASIDLLGHPLTATVLRDFLHGGMVVGDASKVLTLFDVERWLRTLDLGVGQYLDNAQRRRRHLLQQDQSANTNDPPPKQSILGVISGGLKLGVSTAASLTRFVGAMLSGQLFAGADLSMLFSTQSVHSRLVGTTVSAPPIAFAEFTYKALMPIVLDTVALARAGRFSVAPIWLSLSEMRDLYAQIVDVRLLQACAGVRLMFGSTSQVAQALYWNCRAGAAIAPAMLQLLTTLLSDVPLYRCLCVYPAGTDYLLYVQGACTPFIPPARKAYWQVRPAVGRRRAPSQTHTRAFAPAPQAPQSAPPPPRRRARPRARSRA